MQTRILQSVAYTWVFKLYLSSDHVTPATGKTVAVTLSKNTAAFGNPSAGSSNATEIASGWYYFTSSTTDTGTVGPLIWLGTCTGCDNADQAYDVVKATNSGLTAIPDTAATTNASLLTSGTGTDQLSVSAGKVLLQATQSGVTIPTVTTLTNLPSIPANWLTAAGINASALNGKGDWLLSSSYTAPPTVAAIATGIWTDTTAGDFTTATSPGKIIFTQLGGAFTTTSSSVFSTASLANGPTGGSAPTVSQIATAVWQDATAGDFTAASSIGKSLYTGGVVPGGANGLFIAGTNAATVITTSLTTHFVGTIDTVTTYTGNTPQTGDAFARLGAPAGASIAADLAEIEAETDGIAAIPTSNPTAAAIATTVWTDLLASSDFSTASSIGAKVKADVNQTGDAYALIGPTGSGLTSLALHTDVTTILAAIGTPAQAATLATDVTNIITAVGTPAQAGSVTVTTNLDKTGYSMLLTQPLNAARALDSVADTSLTVNDAMQCAVASVTARIDASSGTACIWKTASTGTTLRTKALTLAAPPLTVPTKAV